MNSFVFHNYGVVLFAHVPGVFFCLVMSELIYFYSILRYDRYVINVPTCFTCILMFVTFILLFALITHREKLLILIG